MTHELDDPFVSALLVGDYAQNRSLMQEIFRDRGWRLYEAPDRKRALQCLERNPIQAVLMRCEARDWPWKRAWRELQKLSRPPQLIVTSRTGDHALWSEVLNWGAYDVLAEPFQRDEVERVIASACRRGAGQTVYTLRMQAAAS